MRYEGASKPRGSLKCKLTCAGGCRPRHGEANGICAAIFRGLVEATVPKALAAFSLKQSTSQEDSLEVLDSSCSNTRGQRISSTSRRTRSVSQVQHGRRYRPEPFRSAIESNSKCEQSGISPIGETYRFSGSHPVNARISTVSKPVDYVIVRLEDETRTVPATGSSGLRRWEVANFHRSNDRSARIDRTTIFSNDFFVRTGRCRSVLPYFP